MEGANKGETLRRDVLPETHDLTISLAQVLRDKGQKIRVLAADEIRIPGAERRLDAIDGSREAIEVLDRLCSSQEFKVLANLAHNQFGFSDVEKDIQSSRWDEETKKDVLVLWLHTEAARNRRFKLELPHKASPGTDIWKAQHELEKSAQEKEARAKEIGGSRPRPTSITPQIMHSLVEKLVDRELQPRETPQGLRT